MNGRAGALLPKFAALPHERARLREGLPELEALYRDMIRAFAPPNPQFERERIIAALQAPREIAFILGFLSEGENEAALLLELIGRAQAAEPDIDLSHVVDEAWYYLRTSIDSEWQLDDGPPCASAAVLYLVTVFEARLAQLTELPRVASLAGEGAAGRAQTLRALRSRYCSPAP